MARHMRQVIRERVKSELLGGTLWASRVWSGRVAPLDDNEMPGLLVMSQEEDSREGANTGGATTDRRLMLVIEGAAQGGDDLLDTVDEMTADIEAVVMAGDATLGGLAMNIEPPATNFLFIEDDDARKRRTVRFRMVFPVTYRTRQADPRTQV